MRNAPSQSTGFTIIELLVAMTIASVMMAIAIPAFNDFTTQRRMAANVNSLVGAVNYARNEATRLGATVTLQATDAGDSDNEWGLGFCVNAADNGDCDDSLQRFEIEGAVTFDALGLLNNVDSLSFNSRGLMLGGVQGTIQLCGEDEDDDPGRSLNINAIGRVSVIDLTCYP